MNPLSRNLLLMAMMLAAAFTAPALRPTSKIADQKAAFTLATLVPTAFGEWRELPQQALQVVNPQQQQMLDGIYSQTLSRTYVNTAGYRVMLSIAYGGDQSRDLQVHRPEVCYAAQGFRVSGIHKVLLDTRSGPIPAMRLLGRLGRRNEPITYWVRIGDKIVRGNVEQGLARLSYGLQGFVADGLLFRVSSIDDDAAAASRAQDQFIADLLFRLPEASRTVLAGGYQGDNNQGLSR